ncbi:MAG: hypothetical protein JO229_05785 [Alphaproteobacteria bacterium]|nr:hypothetical protein [Alphaproteobacteria bacterium]MBV9815247.1 hypothetical protein [Alphaproteobacteria bacterium]
MVGARIRRGPCEGHRFRQAGLGSGSDDPQILANAAFALAAFGEDIGAMIALVDRAT